MSRHTEVPAYLLHKLVEHPNFKSVEIAPTDYDAYPKAAGKITVTVNFKDSEWRKMPLKLNSAFVDEICEGLFTGYIVMVTAGASEGQRDGG